MAAGHSGQDMRIGRSAGTLVVCRKVGDETRQMLSDRAWMCARILAKTGAVAQGRDVEDAHVLSSAWCYSKHYGCGYAGAVKDEVSRL